MKISLGLKCLIVISCFYSLALTAIPLEEQDQKNTVCPLFSQDDSRRLTQTIEKIQSNYVKPVKTKKLFSAALHGLLLSLDPHSTYLEEDDFKDLKRQANGKFVGLGLELTREHGFIKVVTPFDDSPAQKAGILSGQYILAVDDERLTHMSITEAVKKMRGKKGTSVTLTLLDPQDKTHQKITLVRESFSLKSVKSEMFEGQWGYIRLSRFPFDVAFELADTIFELKKQGHLKGLILDLRNNPGGILSAAGEVADLFLDTSSQTQADLIFYSQGRTQTIKDSAYVTPGDILEDMPLVVMINEGSASAAEIVAGALQDHKRALIVGQRSFGKGSIQTVFPLDQKSAVKLTTAFYYTPLGHTIQSKGIQPDITFEEYKSQEDVQFTGEDDRVRDLRNRDVQLYKTLQILKNLYQKQTK